MVLFVCLDRTQQADVTANPDDYVSRYAKIIGSYNNYSVFDRDLPGILDTMYPRVKVFIL